VITIVSCGVLLIIQVSGCIIPCGVLIIIQVSGCIIPCGVLIIIQVSGCIIPRGVNNSSTLWVTRSMCIPHPVGHTQYVYSSPRGSRVVCVFLTPWVTRSMCIPHPVVHAQCVYFSPRGPCAACVFLTPWFMRSTSISDPKFMRSMSNSHPLTHAQYPVLRTLTPYILTECLQCQDIALLIAIVKRVIHSTLTAAILVLEDQIAWSLVLI